MAPRRKRKAKKRNPRPKIEYPPLVTKKWIPPDQRKKKKLKPPYMYYVKPPGISQRLKISSLKKVWNQYKIIDNRTILLGSFSETHKRFRPKSNGFQSPCNCIIAAAFSRLFDMRKWNTPTIDKILELGDQLYLISLLHLEGRGRTHIGLTEVYASFFLYNTKITMSVKAPCYTGKLFEDFEDTPFLKNVIKDFFNDKYVTGIITTQNKYLTFWFSDNSYYLFDPTEHDEKAYPWKGVPSWGYAFVMRFANTDDLVDVIHENVNKSLNSKFILTPCFIVRMVKLNTKPPEHIKIAHCPEYDGEDLEAKKPPKPEKIPEEAEEKIIQVTNIEIPDVDEYEELDEFSPEIMLIQEDSDTPVQRKEVTKSMVPIERPKAESITYFSSVVFKKIGILRASTFQGDTRFSPYAGKQSMANAMAALTMLRIHKSRVWITRIVDEILLLGEVIHKDTLNDLPADQTLKVTTTCKKITLEERQFTPDVEEYSAVGKLQSINDEVLDLMPALQEFFMENDSCIITGPLILAVWKEDGLYYMFDPNERDKNGLVIIKTLQIGSDLKVLEYVPGVACVTWFKNLKDLAEVYLNNVDKQYRRDPFILSRVQINDVVKIPDPWHNFQGVAQGKWILRGTFNQNDRRFDKETRNMQSTAAASVALAYSRLKHVREWDVEDVDEVLLQGDTLHKSSVEYLKECNKYVDPKLMITEVKKRFPLESNEIVLEIEDCLVNGLLDAKDDNDELNLQKAMQEFFKDNETGVLTTRSISVAVWKNEEIYYYYDSHSRDEAGVIKNFGTSCILRILDIGDLAKSIEANLNPGTNNEFNISRVAVKLWQVTEEGIRPPLNNYVEVNATSAILRSLFNERSIDFKLNRGKQTIPMCLAAAGMINIYPPAIWSRDVVDEILYIGDELYTDTMIKREKTTDLPEEDDIDEVYAENCIMEYNIGLNKFFLSYGEPLNGNFEKDFQKNMTIFFGETVPNEQTILFITSDVYTVMTWQEDGLYYLFDPRPRDEGGQVYGKEEWTLKMPPGDGEEEGDDFIIPKGVNMIGAGDSPKNESPSGEITEEKRRSIGSQASEELENLNPKHSTHYWRSIEDTNGKACVMWFTALDKLVQHILENTPPTKREDINFKLLPVTVVNKPEHKNVYDPLISGEREDNYSGDWYEFQEIDHGRWILRGTMDYTHIMFPVHNRGRQSVAMCFIALAYVKRFALSKFKSITVNDILKYGDRLHTATRNGRSKKLKENKSLALSEQEIEAMLNNETYGVNDIAQAFCIGQDQMRAEVVPKFLHGDINAQDDNDVLNVKKGLIVFFEENKSGIVMAKDLNVAVWRGFNVYYMFDPHSRGPNGVKCTNGEACITRYLDVGALADVFIKNLTKDGNNAFIIHHVQISIVPCPREPKPEEKQRIEERPKLHGYTMVLPGVSILHGTLSQDDPKFGRGRNVQCAPIAIVALTLTLIHKASIWTKPIIDEILIMGDELYAATLDSLGFSFNPWEQGMTVHLVNKDYKLGTVRANCELRTTDQRGVIDIKHPKILNLRQGVEKFFEENTHGVIETETLTVAVWEEEDQPDLIYMYDPNPRGPAGLTMNGGTACLLVFESPKLVADHFIANITDKTKRSGEFVITPVEIVVGNLKTKRKELDPCICKPEMTVKRPGTQAEKRKLRKMAEEERAKKEAQRVAKLGKFEYYILSNGDGILRGTKSQTWKGYSDMSQGNQDLTNCIAAFVMHHLVPVSNWHYKHIDLVLDVGEQLYVDSYITYSPRDPKLGLENILRKVFVKDVKISLKVYKPVMCNTLTAFNLEMALINYFQQEQFGILSANGQHVGLFFKQGNYYMFDPHDRDLEGNTVSCGCACVMKFDTIPNLIDKFIRNTVTIFDSVKIFTITLVTIGNITKMGDNLKKCS